MGHVIRLKPKSHHHQLHPHIPNAIMSAHRSLFARSDLNNTKEPTPSDKVLIWIAIVILICVTCMVVLALILRSWLAYKRTEAERERIRREDDAMEMVGRVIGREG